MSIDLKRVFSRFITHGDFISASPYGSGHINDTFAVNCEIGGAPVRYLMQRINHNIFKDPKGLMDNIRRVTQHQQSKLDMTCPNASRRALTLIESKNNLPYYIDDGGNYWRMYVFVEKATSYDVIETPSQAYEAAKAFGMFQNELVDLPGDRLIETIPDFHNTPKRYEALMEAIRNDTFNRASIAAEEIKVAEKMYDCASVLVDLQAEGKIPERVTHNDTKLNNVLLDDITGEGICVIDLDTVMPGLALYDFGDLIRSATRSSEEDERDLEKVQMQMPLFKELLKGYLNTAGGFLTQTEKEHLIFSGKLISLEIGVRFLTDFLSGDTYFKVHREGHNLDRCKVQFKMVQSITEQEEKMNKHLEDYL